MIKPWMGVSIRIIGTGTTESYGKVPQIRDK